MHLLVKNKTLIACNDLRFENHYFLHFLHLKVNKPQTIRLDMFCIESVTARQKGLSA